jgi:hypothetical protein
MPVLVTRSSEERVESQESNRRLNSNDDSFLRAMIELNFEFLLQKMALARPVPTASRSALPSVWVRHRSPPSHPPTGQTLTLLPHCTGPPTLSTRLRSVDRIGTRSRSRSEAQRDRFDFARRRALLPTRRSSSPFFLSFFQHRHWNSRTIKQYARGITERREET